jgi:membrane-bound ClpP family serine protease
MTALGLVLVVLGAGLLIAEAHVPSAGILGVGGAISLAAGALVLITGAGAGLIAAVIVAVVVGAAALGALLLAAPHVAATRRRRVRTGREAMVGHLGVVRSAEPKRVFVDGALWLARPVDSDDADEDLHEGDRVVVEGVTGLTLSVRKAEEWEVSQ